MALNFPSPAYDGEIYVDPTSGSKYIYVAASTKWMSIQHIPVTTAFGFDRANVAYSIANLAFDMANAAYLIQNVDFTLSNAAFTHANAAYDFSNSAYASINSNWTVTNTVYGVANAAYSAANNVGPQIAPAYTTANLAFDTANNVYASVNSNWTVTNTVYGVANAAYGAANNVGPQIAPAFNTANAAFGKANTALQNTTGTFSGTLTVTGNIIMGGGTSVGYLTIPQNSQTSAYVLVASDTGKHISITTGGVTVNASVFSVGDTVLIYNNSGSNQTITQGTNVTLRLSGTATTGNRTLAQYGTATILCVTGGANPVFVISGSGLS